MLDLIKRFVEEKGVTHGSAGSDDLLCCDGAVEVALACVGVFVAAEVLGAALVGEVAAMDLDGVDAFVVRRFALLDRRGFGSFLGRGKGRHGGLCWRRVRGVKLKSGSLESGRDQEWQKSRAVGLSIDSNHKIAVEPRECKIMNFTMLLFS